MRDFVLRTAFASTATPLRVEKDVGEGRIEARDHRRHGHEAMCDLLAEVGGHLSCRTELL
ncbi:hypothetical protein GCM10027445_03940 [Amycolatopsis endophytica]|uniref:Uncharacterized protein n=1 Tax=Amycolatopsis endophytica TaxID=860233 RepID=A0A853B7I8_9PSEU|nr:hypothetical protein [Amycolatopsis endophytica]NYI91268.1 hypothetical protein [Amycolatopsis endophytica]